MKSRVAIICIVGLLSCSVDHQEYTSFLLDPQNGLVKTASVNGSNYRMTYQPIELMVANESRNTKLNHSTLSSQMQGLDYFLLDINKQIKVQDSKSDFYYAYQFEKDIFQLINHDTIRPSLYNLEHGIGGSQQFRINIAFPKLDGDQQIFINDKYGSSTEFVFNQNDINKIPKLKM